MAKLRGKQNDDDDGDDDDIYIVYIFFFHLDQARNFAVWKKDTLLHGPSMLPDEAKFVECSIIILALSFLMKHLVIGQLQKPAKFSAFHWSPS